MPVADLPSEVLPGKNCKPIALTLSASACPSANPTPRGIDIRRVAQAEMSDQRHGVQAAADVDLEQSSECFSADDVANPHLVADGRAV